MKYTVTVNAKSKTVTVNLNGYEGIAKCCDSDSFNLQTGIELALERARVAKANAEAKKNPTAKSGDVMELVKALEKALPKGQIVIVGNGDGLTAKHKAWLHSLTDCHKSNGGYTEEDLDKAYREGYEDGQSEEECECCDCDNCDLCHTEEEYAKAYDEGYDEGYEDGYSDGYDEGCDNIDEDAIIDAVRKVLRK